MNGISLNGINNNIFQNPLMQNPMKGNKGILPNQSENVKNDMIPKGTVSGVEKLEDEQKSGFAIQMNADKDTFEFSGQSPEVKKGIDKPIAETTEEERENLALEYLEECKNIEEQFKNGEITEEQRNKMRDELWENYKINDVCLKEDGSITVHFKCDESTLHIDPNERRKMLTVNISDSKVQGIVDSDSSLVGRLVDNPIEISSEEYEKLMSAKEEMAENADHATQAIADDKQNKVSSQLIKTLMGDYAFQGEKTAVERLKERIEEERAQQKESRQERFEAFA